MLPVIYFLAIVVIQTCLTQQMVDEWEADIPIYSHQNAGFICASQNALVVANRTMMVGLSSQDGSVLWGPRSFQDRYAGCSAPNDLFTYTNASGVQCVAKTATGENVWCDTSSGPAGCDTSPKNFFCCSVGNSTSSSLQVIDRMNGSLIWEQAVSIPMVSVACNDNVVVVGSYNGLLFGFASRTGSIIFNASQIGNGTLFFDDVIYGQGVLQGETMGTAVWQNDSFWIYMLSLPFGKGNVSVLWSYQTSFVERVPLVALMKSVEAGVLYYGPAFDFQGVWAATNLSDGQLLWRTHAVESTAMFTLSGNMAVGWMNSGSSAQIMLMKPTGEKIADCSIGGNLQIWSGKSLVAAENMLFVLVNDNAYSDRIILHAVNTSHLLSYNDKKKLGSFVEFLLVVLAVVGVCVGGIYVFGRIRGRKSDNFSALE